jgi:hypothetical protein
MKKWDWERGFEEPSQILLQYVNIILKAVHIGQSTKQIL